MRGWQLERAPRREVRCLMKAMAVNESIFFLPEFGDRRDSIAIKCTYLTIEYLTPLNIVRSRKHLENVSRVEK